MIEQIYTYFTIDMIYLWLNIGILPFWIILIFLPKSKICKIFISSIFPIFILGSVYIYLVFELFASGFNFLNGFNLYIGIEELRGLLGNKNYLILFWVHFLAMNLFSASWIVNDSQRYLMPKFLCFVPLIVTYFVGPIGIFIYWILKMFFSKKISLYE